MKPTMSRVGALQVFNDHSGNADAIECFPELGITPILQYPRIARDWTYLFLVTIYMSVSEIAASVCRGYSYGNHRKCAGHSSCHISGLAVWRRLHEGNNYN